MVLLWLLSLRSFGWSALLVARRLSPGLLPGVRVAGSRVPGPGARWALAGGLVLPGVAPLRLPSRPPSPLPVSAVAGRVRLPLRPLRPVGWGLLLFSLSPSPWLVPCLPLRVPARLPLLAALRSSAAWWRGVPPALRRSSARGVGVGAGVPVLPGVAVSAPGGVAVKVARLPGAPYGLERGHDAAALPRGRAYGNDPPLLAGDGLAGGCYIASPLRSAAPDQQQHDMLKPPSLTRPSPLA